MKIEITVEDKALFELLSKALVTLNGDGASKVEVKEETSEVTLSDLRDLLREFIKHNSRDQAIEILEASGANSLSSLKESEFGTVADKLKTNNKGVVNASR